MTRPFTAARARNAGFKRLRELAPDLNYVQFIDGDCELIETWPETAISFPEFACDRLCGARTKARAIPGSINLQSLVRSRVGYSGWRSYRVWRGCHDANQAI